MRIYIPATTDELDPALLQARGLDVRRVHAVTSMLSADYPSFDTEELEDIAQYIAALDSLPLIASRPNAQRRRVYIAADVPDSVVTTRQDGHEADFSSELWLTEPVTWPQITCAFVDAADAEPVIGQVLEGETEPAELDDHDLLWFDPSELGDLS